MNEQRLIEALKDALEGMEDMVGYVPDYFRWKWDHDAYIDRAKAVLAEACSTSSPAGTLARWI